MKVIVKEPGEYPGHYEEIQNTLAALQKIVKGYIEAVTIRPGVVVICDEEGLLKGKDYNCMSFVGTIVVVGVNGADMVDVPLTLPEWEAMIK